MSRDRRLQRLEQDAQAPEDPGLCFDCRPGDTYGQRLDHARLRVGAQGRLADVEPEEARSTLREILANTPPELDHCGKCGGLTPTGEIRERRTELGLT